MDKEKIIVKRLKELADLIKKHNYNYHTLDSPKITDREFDKLVRENDNLEKKYPSLVLKDGPNKNYGSKIIMCLFAHISEIRNYIVTFRI